MNFSRAGNSAGTAARITVYKLTSALPKQQAATLFLLVVDETREASGTATHRTRNVAASFVNTGVIFRRAGSADVALQLCRGYARTVVSTAPARRRIRGKRVDRVRE